MPQSSAAATRRGCVARFPLHLLEYTTDARHIHALRDSLSARLRGVKATAALAAAVERRITLAHLLAFSSSNREENVRVDQLLVAALRAAR